MTKPTKAEWDGLKRELSGVYGQQFLECDGYFVCARLFLDKRTIKIMVFIDGGMDFNGANVVDENAIDSLPEHKRKLWRISSHSVYPAKFIAKQEKLYGKRACTKAGLYKRIIKVHPTFNTSGAMITHFKKHCENIAILHRDEYEVGLARKQAASQV